jgi:rhamnose utilization protein RhaD (predicted bifunctional aldolase and dehydrogenase)
VLHTHPTVVNALTCAKDGQRVAAEILGDDALWIPYIDPGLPLARLIASKRRAHEARTGDPAPRVLLLQNHGMIVTGESEAEVAARCERIVDVIRRRLEAPGPAPAASSIHSTPSESVEAVAAPSSAAASQVLAAALRQLLAEGDRPKAVIFDGSPAALEIASTVAGRELVEGGPLTPDQIVYAGSWPLWLEPNELNGSVESEESVAVDDGLRDRLRAHVAATGAAPSVVLVAGLGLFVVADSEKFAATAREVILDAMRVAQGAVRLGGVRVLTPDERRFIEEWEAEAYRRGIEVGTPSKATAT